MNMQINDILMNQLYPTAPVQPTSDETRTAALSKGDGEAFSGLMSEAISALDDKQTASNEAIRGLVTGEADDLHTVMVKSTEAQLSLELAVQLRNKTLEAFNEIKNMQF